MDVGDGRSQTWVETERERGFGRLLRRSDAARLQPEASVFLRRFFQANAALFHKAKKVCFLVQRDLIFCDVAGFSSAIIVTIAFDHSSCANFYLRCFVPERPVKRQLLAEGIFPSFASSDLEILVLR
jgi:hypothetical protein